MFRCNLCLRLLHLFADSSSADSVKTYYSECKHIFCVDCLRRIHPNCGVCCRPSRYIEMQKTTRLRHRILFEPVSQVINQVNKAISFQAFHQKYNINRLFAIGARLKQHEDMLRQRIEALDASCREHTENIVKTAFIINKTKEAR